MLLLVAATEPELRGASSLDDVETLACGVGPVDAAARVATRVAREPRPDAVLHVGIAGARRASMIPIGTTVIGDRSTYRDTRSSLVPHELEPDAALLERIRHVLPDAHVQDIGTSADVGGTSECDVEAMEGFAVLRAAHLAGIPAIEVRVVSNEIEEDDRDKWRFDLALAELERILPMLVAELSPT